MPTTKAKKMNGEQMTTDRTVSDSLSGFDGSFFCLDFLLVPQPVFGIVVLVILSSFFPIVRNILGASSIHFNWIGNIAPAPSVNPAEI